MNKNIISAIALRLGCLALFASFGAVAAPLAPAANSQIPSQISQDDVTGSISPASTAQQDGEMRVTCHNGLARDGMTQHRGWFCNLDRKGSR